MKEVYVCISGTYHEGYSIELITDSEEKAKQWLQEKKDYVKADADSYPDIYESDTSIDYCCFYYSYSLYEVK